MAADRIRTTISLDPAVHAIFVAMAEASGMSVSRCMGDWLADTAEGAQFVALKMQEARKAPKLVMREMQAMSKGLVEEVEAVLGQIRESAVPEGRSPAQAKARRAAPLKAGGVISDALEALQESGRLSSSDLSALVEPPCSPTGVKSPRKVKGKGGQAL